MRPDIARGGTFPDHEPPDHTKRIVQKDLDIQEREGWNTRGVASPGAV